LEKLLAEAEPTEGSPDGEAYGSLVS